MWMRCLATTFISWGSQLGYVDSTFNNMTAAQWPVKTFICPSDTQKGTMNNQVLGTGTFAVTNYKACNGCNWPVSVNPATKAPPARAVTCPKGRNFGSPDGLDHGNGIYLPRRRPAAPGIGGSPPGGAPILPG